MARPARNALSWASGSAARRASTSAPVEVCPSVKRSAPRASDWSSPIPRSTWLASGIPAWQAEPVLTETPAASNRYRRESPSQPGKVKCALVASRHSGSPRSTADGIAARTPAMSLSRSALTSGGGACAATANATAAGASWVPDRTCRCWPPPWIKGTTFAVRARTRAPSPSGPPILCAETDRAASPEPAKSMGRWR